MHGGWRVVNECCGPCCVAQVDDLVMPISIHDVRYLGFVDVADLVAAILTSGLTYSKPTTWLGRLSDLFLEDSKHLVRPSGSTHGADASIHAAVCHLYSHASTPPRLLVQVDSAINMSGRDKFLAITTKDSLVQVRVQAHG